MYKEEWLAIGYEKGIIDEVEVKDWVIFLDVYKAWFKTKINCIRPQSVDRIEMVYNKYYRDSELSFLPVHQIDESVIYRFLNDIIISSGKITLKEYQRIYQIVNNVLTYASDLNLGYAKVINWSMVKRYIAFDNLASSQKKEYCISMEERQALFRSVLVDRIYLEKRSASLCLVLNFYLGLRIGELASLQWKDINFSERYIQVHTTETKAFKRDDDGERTNMEYFTQDRTKTVHSVRNVPLVNESVYILSELKRWHEEKGYSSPYLAYDGTETILSKSLERTLRRLCVLCDISQFSSHRIRKTFASELHRNGVPTKMISSVMGHADMRTTEQSYILNYSDELEFVRNAMQKGLVVAL